MLTQTLTSSGNAELDIAYYSPKDNRFEPNSPDGAHRPNTLLVTRSAGVVVKDIRLTNSTDWTFRMDASRDICASGLHVDVTYMVMYFICAACGLRLCAYTNCC